MRSGRKVRHPNWPKGWYIEIEGPRILQCTEGGHDGTDWCPRPYELTSDRWEVYNAVDKP